MVVVIILSVASFVLLSSTVYLASQLRNERRYTQKLKKWVTKSPYEKLTGCSIEHDTLSTKALVDQYIEHGGRLNDTTIDGVPILLDLVMHGRLDIADEFIERGADPDAKTMHGLTAYFMLINNPNKTCRQSDFIVTLINKDADRTLVPDHYDNPEVKAAYDAGDYKVAQAISKALDNP